MHICVISEHFHKRPSGPRTACIGLARGLAELGCRVSLLSVMAHENARQPIPGGEARVVRYGWRLIPVSLGRGRFYARELGRIHRAHAIDAVIAMGWEAADAAQVFCERHGVPWLVNPRSCSKDRPGNWRNDRARKFFDASRGMIAISEYAADDWSRNLGRPRGKIRAVLNGCDLAALEGDALAPPSMTAEGAPIILTMGGLRPSKGHAWIARALAGLPGDWRWVIAGEGRSRREIRQLVEKLDLSHRTTFTGNVEGAQWRWLYRNAAVFTVFPVYPEACGNAYLEAQAAGLPVVASNAGALPEVTLPGESSLLVDGTDMDDEARGLREALARVLGDAGLRARMGRAGRAHAASLTWRTCAEKYLAAVKGVPAATD